VAGEKPDAKAFMKLLALQLEAKNTDQLVAGAL